MSREMLFNYNAMSTSLAPPNKLFDLIDIKEPYFAFEDILINEENEVVSKAPVEQAIGSEVFPISTAEAIRHMDILNSISCAFANPFKTKHFYLANHVIYKRFPAYKSTVPLKNVRVKSSCKFLDARKSSAYSLLTDISNSSIAEAEIFYDVLPDFIFKKIHQKHYRECPDYKIINPYRLKSQLFDIRFFNTHATATLGMLPEYSCAGHFPHFPALPLSSIIYNLLDLSGLFIYRATRDYGLRFSIKELELMTNHMAFAEDEVDFEIKKINSSDNLFTLSGIALANKSKMIADVKVAIELIKN